MDCHALAHETDADGGGNGGVLCVGGMEPEISEAAIADGGRVVVGKTDRHAADRSGGRDVQESAEDRRKGCAAG